MDLFRYLMTKNGHNYLKDDDLFSYKLAKGQGGTYAIFEGTTINANNTRRGKMKLSLKGNTSQDGTPTPDNPIPVNVVSGDNEVVVRGKNLIDKTKIVSTNQGNWEVEQTTNGIKLNHKTQWSTGQPTLTLTLKPNTTYTYSQVSTTDASIGITPDGGTTGYLTNTGSISKATGSTGTITITFGAPQGEIADFDYIQLEENSTKTDYTPYQSQTYPINLGTLELCKIGTYQDKFIRNSGKNKISQQQRATNLLYFNGATGYDSYVFEAGTYTFSYTDTNSCNVYMQKNGGSPVDLGSSKLINITSDTSFNFWIYRSGLTDGEVNQAMLVEGTYTSETMPPYEPYGNGDWYLEKHIGEYTFNGSEEYTQYSTTNKFHTILDNALFSSGVTIKCDKYLGQSSGGGGSDYANYTCWLQELPTYKRIYFRNDFCADASAFTTFMSNNNATVIYPLETPTYTKITGTLAEQLNALQNSRSYDGQTNINQNNNDLASNMEAQILVNE